MDTPGTSLPGQTGWQRLASASVRAFHAYAGWLVSISWWRFLLLALLLLMAASLLQEVPPFSWRVGERTPVAKAHHRTVNVGPSVHYEVTIDDKGVRIGPQGSAASAAASHGAGSAPTTPQPPTPPSAPSVSITLPPGADSDEIRSAVEEARQAIEDRMQEARDAAQAAAEGEEPVAVRLGEHLPNLALIFVIASAIIKINYQGRLRAEVKAAQATETAESESLKRQVVEARMAAMQAQVEPHFLFNTLASIDHLIEVDPPRASVMQKHLIALLRASMPTLRETSAQGVVDLGRELAVVRPYLEILALRMEERLQTEIVVPEGLLSAQIPPMMIQSLVENAIKHGLEPKPEGGRLTVRAEIVHGHLAVSVTDTGLGFGRGATAGTGVGLENIRERLQLLYGSRAALAITEPPAGGTCVTISVPYTTSQGTAMAASNGTGNGSGSAARAATMRA